ncbi:MAG: zinc ribbon domain-containing protein, partial [Blastocatellia bacterium]
MYCPCCGFKNSESASYCRSCGADPQTMCEALEGRIPAASAAKLLLRKVEERLGRRTEFFRLQSISALIWAVAFFGFQIHSHHWPFPLSMPFFIPLMALLLFVSGKGCLVYKRSKTFYTKSKRRAQLPTSLFCPCCGTQSSFETGHCGSCGQSLEVVRQALQGEPSKLARMLDDEIARADGVFVRWSRRKLIALALTMLLCSGINSLGIAVEYAKMDGLLMLLVYSPS